MKKHKKTQKKNPKRMSAPDDGAREKSKLWPTPRTRMISRGRARRAHKCRLEGVVDLYAGAPAGGSLLNPDWVAQIMGVPDGWFDVEEPVGHAAEHVEQQTCVEKSGTTVGPSSEG